MPLTINKNSLTQSRNSELLEATFPAATLYMEHVDIFVHFVRIPVVPPVVAVVLTVDPSLELLPDHGISMSISGTA